MSNKVSNITFIIDGEPWPPPRANFITTMLGRTYRCWMGPTGSGRAVLERVSVLLVEPGERIGLRPHEEPMVVVHVAWVLGAVCLTTDDGQDHVLVAGAGWPTVDRVVEASA